MRPDGLSPILADRGHAPTRTSSSCCLGEVRDGAARLRRESGRLTNGTTAREHHRRAPPADDGTIDLRSGEEVLAAEPAGAGARPGRGRAWQGRDAHRVP